MKFHSPMIIVADIEKSKQFYIDVLQETVSLDLGTYVVMGGFSMMTRETWNEDTKDGPAPDKTAGHGFELYFEESHLDDFVASLGQHNEIVKFSPLTEAPWGQRTIRFFDPDNHVIEVAEPMEDVVVRLLASGMTVQETFEKSMMPIEFIQKCDGERDKTS
jgi:catechol 2,3-dioxygenase-like lactoylglutathione lyase family enzyme